MSLKFAFILFGSSLATLAATGEAGPFSEVNAIERLTISGLLLVAVIFLYRELSSERKKGEAREESMKEFITKQTELIGKAAESQSEALGQVAQALGTQQSALEAQITIFREHINTILKSATHKDP